jgi:hypothetical protein
VKLRVLLCTIVLVGCGGDDEPAPAEPGSGTRLEVVVHPQGADGPAVRRTVTDTRLTARDLRPVAPMTACTEIYGGPATATVTGTLDGQEVDAEFRRTNGCEIARWERAQELLGPAP